MRITFLAVHSADNYPGMPQWTFSLAFAYLRAYLTTSPHYDALRFTDLDFYEYHDDAAILAGVGASRPDLVAISCYVWNFAAIQRLLPAIRAANPQARLVLGGPEIAHDSQPVMAANPEVDFMVTGEGEKTFRALIEHLLNDAAAPQTAPLWKTPGIFFRDPVGQVVFTGRPANIQNLDEIPSPFLLGLIPEQKIRGGLAALETQRGCVLDCAFCNYQKGFKNVRYFDLGRVLREVEWILARGPRQLYLMDPAFNSNRKRAAAILERIAQRRGQGERFAVNAEMIPDMLNETLIALSARAGIRFVEMGVQSLTPAAVEQMRRYRNEPKLFRAVELAAQYGIEAAPQIIFGLPGDGFEPFLETFDRVYALPVKTLDVLHLLMLPGTHYRSRVEALGIRFDPNPPYRIIESHDFTADEIRRLGALSRLTLATLPMKPYLLVLAERLGRRPSQLLMDFIDQGPPERFDHHWPIQDEAARDRANDLVRTFLGFLQGVMAEAPAGDGVQGRGADPDGDLDRALAREARRAQFLLAGHLITRSRRSGAG